ncbi:glutaredoxin-like protein [Acrasis kona]|uniref:Glutaredoxin-like protein n=1 Tax=Acrasis kona TaxID=1008807 RepID=A0AAW2ZHQ8_9EUKA
MTFLCTRVMLSGASVNRLVTIYTKTQCGLCDKAKEDFLEFNESCKKPFALEERDITKNQEWYNDYQFDVPVFHVDGNFICHHKFDQSKFEHLDYRCVVYNSICLYYL